MLSPIFTIQDRNGTKPEMWKLVKNDNHGDAPTRLPYDVQVLYRSVSTGADL